MPTSNDKILEALSALVPAESRGKIVESVNSFLEATRSELEEEYATKLEEAKTEFETKIQENEQIAENSYAEAYEIILDQRDRMEKQIAEHNLALNSGFEEAYEMLQQERSKNDTVETELYSEYDNKLGEIKEYIVDKVDQFLALKGEEFFETATRNVMNDPAIAEHKVALDKIMEVASTYLDAEDYNFATSSKVDALARQLEEQKGQLKILEARNMRLHTENTKLNEVARQAQDVLTEGARIERTARKNAAKNAEGRGQKELNNVKVISEHAEPQSTKKNEDDKTESRNRLFQEWRALAGYTNDSSSK